MIGLGNSALPFSLYAFAALHVPAGYSAILNSTAPLFAALFADLWLDEPLTSRKIAGLALGCAGVSAIAWRGAGVITPAIAWSAAACLGAAACYGLSGIYVKRFARGVPSAGIAGCSQLAAGVALLPGLAYLLDYRLMSDVGPTRALTVTFLVPVFGVLWGALFLHESITGVMVAGGAVTLTGIYQTVSTASIRGGARGVPDVRAVG